MCACVRQWQHSQQCTVMWWSKQQAHNVEEPCGCGNPTHIYSIPSHVYCQGAPSFADGQTNNGNKQNTVIEMADVIEISAGSLSVWWQKQLQQHMAKQGRSKM